MCSLLKINKCKQENKICNPTTNLCKKAPIIISRCECTTKKNTRCLKNKCQKSKFCLQHAGCKSPYIQYLPNPKCLRQLLPYSDNSCYMDGLLISLLYNQNKFIKSQILEAVLVDEESIELQSYLQKIKYYLTNNSSKSIKYRKKIRQFMHAFSKHHGEYKNFINAQLEPIDIMNVILHLFDLNMDVKSESYGQKSHTGKMVLSNSKTINMSPIILIDSADELFDGDIDNFIHHSVSKPDGFKINNKVYKYRHEFNSFENSKFLYIHINRLYPVNGKRVKNVDPVLIPDMIDNVKLRSIIIHNGDGYGGHYTLYFYCRKFWYYYDDLRSKIEFIGQFGDVLKIEKVLTNCTDLIYY